MHNVTKARELLEATGKYVSKYIENKTNRIAYLEGVNTLIDAFRSAEEEGYDRLKFLMKVGNDFLHTKRFKRAIMANPKRYYHMAFQHATDIVNSIETRFR